MTLLGPLLFLTILIATVVIHEFSHAWVADRLGDPTARLLGRLTLNPLPHLDPVGTIMVPLFLLLSGASFLIGWAKPVPFDPFNLKDPRKDAAKIAIAGPVSNFALAIISAVILRLLFSADSTLISAVSVLFLRPFIQFNILIGLFNLIPVAPLDGFKVVGGVLSESQAREWYGLERYGVIFLLFLIFPFIGGRSMISIILTTPFQFFSSILLP